jgi:hypothetical protein
MPKIYVIHENHEWTIHLTKRLEELGLPYEDWHLDKGHIDLNQEPPQGVFYSRMSASSHTRDHRYSAEYTSAVLSWLERHGRTVYNGTRALALEVSKAAQYAALNAHGIRTPHTLVTLGKEQIIEAARTFVGSPFIVKHNRAGKGLGVQLFNSIDALENYVFGAAFDEPVDGITLVQQYIQAPESYITRCEFVGGKFVYAVRVDTSGGFELCPADACQIGDLFCPVGEAKPEKPKFEILEGFNNPIIEKYEQFLATEGIAVAGIEFIVDQSGEIFTYDINTNTNYNSDAEAVAGKYGMLEVATFLGKQLEALKEVAR